MAKTKTLIEERPEDKARTPHGSPNITKDGREIPDPTPMAPPVGYKKQPSIFENMRKLIHDERILQQLRDQNQETFEEADDFDVDDEMDPTSPYEANFEPASEADRRALRGELPSLDDPELRRLSGADERRPPSNPQDPGEAGGGSHPDDGPPPAAGERRPVRSYFRRPPAKDSDPGERQ